MKEETLIQLPIDGTAYYLNPAHLIAILPVSPTEPVIQLYLSRDALDSLPKEKCGDTWVTLYDEAAIAVLKRYGLQLSN